MAAVTKAAHARFIRDIPVVPAMVPWATDGSIFRAAGIPTYGVARLVHQGQRHLRSRPQRTHARSQSFYDELTYWYVLLKEIAGTRAN